MGLNGFICQHLLLPKKLFLYEHAFSHTQESTRAAMLSTSGQYVYSNEFIMVSL